MLRRIGLLTVALLSAAVPSSAEEFNIDKSDIEKSLNNCHGPQISVNECAAEHARASSEILLVAYDRVRHLLTDESELRAFVLAHERFTEFRDATCAFDLTTFQGGSMGGLAKSWCLVGYDQRRVRSLNHYADCISNLTPCEVPFLLSTYELEDSGAEKAE